MLYRSLDRSKNGVIEYFSGQIFEKNGILGRTQNFNQNIMIVNIVSHMKGPSKGRLPP